MTILRSHIRLLILLVAASPLTAIAQECADDVSCGFNSCRTPVVPAPSVLWGELRPAESEIPGERDTTDFDRFSFFDARNPYFMSVEVANGFLFTAIHSGFQIWDARANPASPALLSQRDGRVGEFPMFPVNPEEKFPVQDIAVPEPRDDLAVVAAVGGAGFSIWDTSVKTLPRALYQDYGKSGVETYAAVVGNTILGFMGSEGTGLLFYDVWRAKTNNTTCTEQTPALICSGVYLGKLGSRSNVGYVHGVDQFVVFSSGAVQRGIEIWNISNPFAPLQVFSGLSSTIVYGVALWNEGGAYYLATREEPGPRLRVYNVSCIATNSCAGSIGSPLADVGLSDIGNARYFLTFSRSGSTPFLHLGSDRSCAGTERREWLYDVSNPFQPRDITPPGAFINGIHTGYWNWYARNTRTGFNFAGMRKARFYGDYLYRAAFAYFDVHRRTSSNEVVASFIWSPTEIYPGTVVSFTDVSAGNPTSWQWTFQDGSPSSSNARNPQVTFSSAGLKSVTLQACAGVCHSTSRTVSVHSAAASVGGVSVSPNSALSCQVVTFTATGVMGQAPISYNWTIRAPDQTSVATCSSNPCVWVPTPMNGTGTYTATVTVRNSANPGGSSISGSIPVTATTLGFTSPSGAPTNNPFAGATVQFHANSQGASEWSWDFDDDNNSATANFGAFISDPNLGPNPLHTYTISGTKTVKVRIRNCVGSILESNPLVVTVSTAGPLVAGFQAQGCPFGVCSFAAGQNVMFVDFSLGSPETWSYDWNNAGTSESGCNFGAAGVAPQMSHVFNTPGSYRPCVRVTRGTQSDIDIHSRITISQSSGPSITISGPSSGQTNQPLTFGATTSNCTAPGAWVWNVGDATGGSTTSTIQLSWTTPGTKQISVTNSGCSGAQGSASVVITAPTGDPLNAVFTISPSNPSAGTVLTFDASGSSGSPTAFTWEMGDGSPLLDGVFVQHAFAQAGTYIVKLTVARPGTGQGCALGYCTDTETRTINVTASRRRRIVRSSTASTGGTSVGGAPARLTSDDVLYRLFKRHPGDVAVRVADEDASNGRGGSIRSVS